MAVTIRDVAQRAQVSSATVSRVMNGRSTVDPKLAARVEEAIRATGFVPNSTGRALRRQVADAWTAIVSDSQNPFFTMLVSGIEEVAARNGLSVMLCNTDEDVARERSTMLAAIGHRMAGVVIAAASDIDSDLTPLQNAGVPTVLVDRRIKGYGGDSVLVDNRLAGELAALHALDAGFTRPALISGPRHVSTTGDRADGFLDTLRDAGIVVPDIHRVNGQLRAEEAYAATLSLLDQDQRPDMIFATNGPMTAGAFRALHHRSVAIPREIALIGVDDDLWTRMVSPTVTVIEQPVVEIGRAAAGLLLQRAAEPHRPATTIVLSPTLAVRESSSRS